MTVADNLRDSIKYDKSLTPLIEDYLSQPVKQNNPLISIATKLLSDSDIKDGIHSALRTYIPKYIKEGQETLQLLNTKEGRDWLHSRLDSLLDYLTSEKYRGNKTYICPHNDCGLQFTGKLYICPNCGKSLKWR